MGEKFAVLIAVEHYADASWGPVSFARADAEAMSAALVPLGFSLTNQQVLIDHDATKARIDSRLRRAVEAALDGDELLVYYAGHGFSEVNRNYLTCHDTEIADLVRTSISLQDILDFLKGSRCRRITLFLDACHSGPILREEDRGAIHDMDDVQLRDFFRESEYCVSFTSCKTTEKSYPSKKYGHGIWTYHVLEALTGNAQEAVERDGLVTASSLQNHLSSRVPQSVRKERTGLQTQTPTMYGSMTREFVIADVGPVIASANLAASTGNPTLDRIAFSSEHSLRVKSLSGFMKHHRVPDAINHATEQFVSGISREELDTEVEGWFSTLKTELGYGRKDLEVQSEDGAATIFTPDFSMEISIALDSDDPSEVIRRVELVNVTNAALLNSPEFDRAFARAFDTIEFEYSGDIEVEEVIDRLEAAPDSRVSIDYPHDSSYCRISIDGLSFEMHISARSLRLDYASKQTPSTLLEGLTHGSEFMLAEHGLLVLNY